MNVFPNSKHIFCYISGKCVTDLNASVVLGSDQRSEDVVKDISMQNKSNDPPEPPVDIHCSIKNAGQ